MTERRPDASPWSEGNAPADGGDNPSFADGGADTAPGGAEGIPAAPPPPPSDDDRVILERPRWVRITALVLAAPLLLGLGIGIGVAVAPEDESDAPVASQPVEVTAPVSSSGDEPVAAVAAALAPSVVQLEVSSGGLGSGVIYDSDGYILTAAHVVEGQDDVGVRLPTGTLVDGEVLGADEYTDIAVVRVDRDGLPAARLAVGRELEVGQLAIAIGSPFGLEQTVTSGIISAVHRPVPVLELETTRDMIQTDAPINPGNSGGALADRNGLVIGINNAIQTTSQGNQGVGFAVPIDIAAWVADKIVAGEDPVPAFLGVVGSTPTSGRPGALLTEVQGGTPAAEADLAKGDLITGFEGDPIQSMTELAARIRASEPGTEVTLSVIRDDDEREVDVTLTELPSTE
ncbi:MAG: S1C family serine protease [Actinomycetota bacterium]